MCSFVCIWALGAFYIQLSWSTQQPTGADFTSSDLKHLLCSVSTLSCHPLCNSHYFISGLHNYLWSPLYRRLAVLLSRVLMATVFARKIRNLRRVISIFYFKAFYFSSIVAILVSLNILLCLTPLSVTVSSTLFSPCSLASSSYETRRSALGCF